MAGLYVLWFVVSRPFGGYATLVAFADSRYQSVAPFFYLSRGLSAVMGTITGWFVFALCRRAFDDTVALVAAFFTALAYLYVRDSHFGTTDVTMTALVVLAVASVVRWQDQGGVGNAALVGLTAGLAASVKYNGLGVFVPFAVAWTLRAAGATSWSVVRRDTIAAGAAAAVFVLTFLAASPFILIEWHRFLQDVVEPAQMLNSEFAGLSLVGWSHYAAVTLPAALGWPMYAAGVAGMLGSLIVRFRRTAVVFAFPIAYYAVAGAGRTAFARYILPVVPFLCISAAWLVVEAARWAVHARFERARAVIVGMLAGLVVWPSARNDVLLDRILTRADNRLVAARALVGVIPPGSLVYHSGDPYGRIAFDVQEVNLTLNECDYDEATGRFTPDGRLPAWIILQRSPLVWYSRMPAGVERIVRERYDLVRRFPAGARSPDAVYDQQDAFFLPLTGLEKTIRPGPDFEIYRLRSAQSR